MDPLSHLHHLFEKEEKSPSKNVLIKGFVVCPFLKEKVNFHNRSVEAREKEALGLAMAIPLELMGNRSLFLNKISPSTYLGSGQVQELKGIFAAFSVNLVIVDTALSPVQQRNLEKAWKVKVIDRTGLILEIFGSRARTKEGVLQVELAALQYQRSRLVRSWTHLERQRGGFGFTGGPGESQLELDRRMIDERMMKIKQELQKTVRTRRTQRAARARVPYPVVSLVGYTNAGKSTLFNALTGAQVLAKDVLFATLDPTMREVSLPFGHKIILSDTVGFISDLPTSLIAAFRATLEEVVHAHIILHVQDKAHDDALQQKEDVDHILRELNIHEYEHDADDYGDTNALDDSSHHSNSLSSKSPIILNIWNKVDALSAEQKAVLYEKQRYTPNTFCVSALTGEGFDALKETLENILCKDHKIIHVTIPFHAGALLSWCYEKGAVLERKDVTEDMVKNDEQASYKSPGIDLKLRLSPHLVDTFWTLYKKEKDGYSQKI